MKLNDELQKEQKNKNFSQTNSFSSKMHLVGMIVFQT